MTEIPSIQWFPGHMTKTRRMIQANLSLVDAVVEITDARIPLSSRNPDLNKLIEGKPRIVILNKCDAADDRITSLWLDYYKKQGIPALSVDCRSGKGVNRFIPFVKEVMSELLEKRKKIYDEADFCIATDLLTPSEVAEKILYILHKNR